MAVGVLDLDLLTRLPPSTFGTVVPWSWIVDRCLFQMLTKQTRSSMTEGTILHPVRQFRVNVPNLTYPATLRIETRLVSMRDIFRPQ